MGVLPQQSGEITHYPTTMSTDEYRVEDPDLVDKFDADSRGRIRLGADFADAKLKVAVQRMDDQQNEDTN